ncbi:hypothetical protein BKN38_09325 [Helicobacter sp. CLO-3]|uniref:tetratricopeptide repeat protein n=1 Tax=unclassified Helicobacter TaxID=2593540 RepID=UPI000805338E|nr:MULTISPECIES: tetratricopeptide repeat protein [unclassified Helicobacter]OBV28635.1 hypothetical protein BA723_01855 [Helicobacter sp. CLO-3]OHU81290.1 hypothetical protein BKN38_09325 [Helicobacter sp. CLO-3]
MKRILFTSLVALSLLGCHKNIQTNNPHSLEKKCNKGDAKACFLLGELRYNAESAESNYWQTAEYFQKACDGGDALGCHDLGELYRKGEGVKQDYAQAKEYFGKACDLGFQYGCDDYNKLNKQGF